MMDIIKYSVKNITQRKTRSLLTTLSILIGVMAIFAILSFGLGIKDYVNELATEAGTDKFFLQSKGVGAPGTDDNFYIPEKDIEFISKIKEVDDVAGIYMKTIEIEYKDESLIRFATAFEPNKREMIEEAFTVDIYEGRALDEGDKSKVVLGYLYSQDLFKRPLKVGDKIMIKDSKFNVAGFYEEIGNPSDDSMIYMTQEAFERMWPEKEGKFGYAIGRSKEEDTERLADIITDELRDHKDIEEGEEDFFVQTFQDAIESFTSIINVLNGVLFLIALISVVVAFVNIMNTMYTAVFERTSEIGIMKAIGAGRGSILLIFLMESAILGLIGGILGVALGYLVSVTGGGIAAEAGYSLLKPIFPIELIVGCMIFATSVGAFAGFLPARQASLKNPADALQRVE